MSIRELDKIKQSFSIKEQDNVRSFSRQLGKFIDYNPFLYHEIELEIYELHGSLKGLVSLNGCCKIIGTNKSGLSIEQLQEKIVKKLKNNVKIMAKPTTKKTTTKKPTIADKKSDMAIKTLAKIDALIERLGLDVYISKTGTEFVANSMDKEMWQIANDYNKEYCETFHESDMSSENKMEASNLLYELGFSIRGKVNPYNNKKEYSFYRFYNE